VTTRPLRRSYFVDFSETSVKEKKEKIEAEMKD
jgi:hypothetical protein